MALLLLLLPSNPSLTWDLNEDLRLPIWERTFQPFALEKQLPPMDSLFSPNPSVPSTCFLSSSFPAPSCLLRPPLSLFPHMFSLSLCLILPSTRAASYNKHKQHTHNHTYVLTIISICNLFTPVYTQPHARATHTLQAPVNPATYPSMCGHLLLVESSSPGLCQLQPKDDMTNGSALISRHSMGTSDPATPSLGSLGQEGRAGSGVSQL